MLLLLIIALLLLAGFGFTVHFLWAVLVVVVFIWVIGYFVGGPPTNPSGGPRRWGGRW